MTMNEADMNKQFVQRGDTEWDSMWQRLGCHKLNCGLTDPLAAGYDGEYWQYMYTARVRRLFCTGYYHFFRHRSHPAGGKVWLEIPVSDRFSPSVEDIPLSAGVHTLKTPLDALRWLCQLESELLSIRAFNRLELDTDRYEPDELTFLEDAIIDAGTAYGWFVCFRKEGVIPPLPASARELLCTLDGLGKNINRPFWELAVSKGQNEAACDRAVAVPELI